jgi:hypothetical protein
MVVVTGSSLSLEMAEFLAGRGVDVVEAEPGVEGMDELREVLERMHERRDLSLAYC